MDPLSRTRALYFLLLVWTIFILNIMYLLTKSSSPLPPKLTKFDDPDSDCPNATRPFVTLHMKDGRSFKTKTYNRSSPLIFVSGFPRSGTTLLRAMLDVHSLIHCGMETGVISKIASMASNWKGSAKESARLLKAGVTTDVLDDAVASFILEILAKRGEYAERLCNKDSFNLKWATLLQKLFPNSKFIFMIRDGRAVVHSMISSGISFADCDLKKPAECLETWTRHMKTMVRECQELDKACLPVKYEELVLFPQAQMERILEFLEVPWEENVLHHHNFINKPGGAYLSKLDPSNLQVMKAIHTKAMSKWVGTFPKDVVKQMETLVPMLRILGYDPMANPPNYSHPVLEPRSKISTQFNLDSILDEDEWSAELYPEDEKILHT